MLRVTNLEKSLSLYTDVLGMKLLRQQDFPDGRFTLAFVGYFYEEEGTMIELTHNWDKRDYVLGAGQHTAT